VGWGYHIRGWDRDVVSNLTLADVSENSSVVAANFISGIVQNSRAIAIFRLTTFGFINAAAATGTVTGGVGFWIPHGVTVSGGPEHVVFVIKDVSLADVFSGKHGVAFAQVAFAAVTLVFAYSLSVGVSVSVLDKFTDAGVAVFHSGAFDTVFVLFAD
jgi:hypothetical protein